VKILVPLKRVADPDHASKVRVVPGSTHLDASELSTTTNPFDDYALESALRLTEDGRNPKARLGEVVAVTLGSSDSEPILRAALATGADRALRLEATDEHLDGRLVANALAALVQRESPELVLLGKQTVDGEYGQVPQRLAELLQWPLATFVGAIHQQPDESLHVVREVDGGLERLRLTLPAVIAVDLRVVAPAGVRSRQTPADFKYHDGVRFSPLPAIMKAKRKPLEVLPLSDYLADALLSGKIVGYEAPPGRKAGRKVSSVDELVSCLRHEARVLP